jgi:hypothetical protein
VDVSLPARPPRGLAPLPFAPPPPLATPLLAVRVAAPLPALWAFLFAPGAGALIALHAALGDEEVALGAWRRSAAGERTRTLRFSTPVRSPFLRGSASNRERFALAHASAAAFLVRAECASAGVPFAAAFRNHVQWAAAAAEGAPGACTLRVSGECRFTAPVWGPLRGTIAGESTAGMRRAYATLRAALEARFGPLEELAGAAPPAPPEPRAARLLASGRAAVGAAVDAVQAQAPSPAVAMVVLAMALLLYRAVLLDPAMLASMRRMGDA